MIQVLLLILKILGITLLVLLGLLLLIVAVLLFVPFFYKVRVVHNPDKTQIKAKVSFLSPFLSVTVQYLEKLSYKVRIFGIAFLNSDRPKKERRAKTVKKSKAKQKKKKPVKEPGPEQVSVQTVNEIPEGIHHQEASVPKESFSEKQTLFKTEEKKEKQGFFKKIKGKIQKIRETISKVINKCKKLLHQKDEAKRILNQPETKKAIAFAWGELKHLLKHVLPRKIKGYVAYGAENPATTGQVLGILSVVYAKTGQLLEIRPNFVEKQLECDVEIKGRIQLFTILVIAIKVLCNKELKQLVSEGKGLKEVE